MEDSSQETLHMTEDEYLAYERDHEFPHEFAYGEVLPRIGRSLSHILTMGNLMALMGNHIRDEDCICVGAKMQVFTGKARTYRYPDVIVTCGKPHFADKEQFTLLNPTILIEITSPSTMIMDCYDKLHEYTSMPTVIEYLIVSQNQPEIMHYVRQDSGDWLYRRVVGLDATLDIPTLNCTLELFKVYHKVELDTDQSSS